MLRGGERKRQKEAEGILRESDRLEREQTVRLQEDEAIVRLDDSLAEHSPVEEEPEPVELESEGFRVRPSRAPLDIAQPYLIEREDEKARDHVPDSLEGLDPETEWRLEQEERTGGIPTGWFVLIAFGICGLLVMGLQLRSKEDQGSEEKADVIAGKDLEELTRIAKAERISAIERNTQLEDLLRRYLAAETVDELKGLIRFEDRVLPLVRLRHKKKPLQSAGFDQIQNFIMTAVDKTPFLALNVKLKNGSYKPILVQDGVNPKIDWEATEAWLPVDPEEWITNRPPEPQELRVYLEPSNYYAYDYADESRWQSFRLTFRDTDAYLIGVAEKDSEVAVEILKIFGGKLRPVKLSLVLKLQFEPGSHAPKTALIKKVISHNWCLPSSESD